MARTSTHLAVASHGAAPEAHVLRCRVCSCRLDLDDREDDDLEHGLCASCKDRPEARRLGISLAPVAPRRPHVIVAAPASGSAREFTLAERALITKVHGFVPAQQLLDLCNERLMADLGPDAPRYTMTQLQDEIAKFGAATPAGGHDWASLRKLLAQARRSGLLEKVNEQVIDDFAVLFSLNPKQVVSLKDILVEGSAE
jgi:hypothetical protein